MDDINGAQEALKAIGQRLKAEDSDERRWAVFDLEAFEPDLSLAYLIKAIQDENRAVREAASEVLETIPASISAAQLTPLLGSTRIEVRNTVAAVLVKYGNDAIVDLMEALFHDNEDVRKFGADILGLTRNPRAVDGLCRVALEDVVENVVVSAIEALGKIKSRQALPTLYRIYESDRGMQAETVEAIGLIGHPESALFLESKLTVDDPIVAYAIIDALGNIAAKSSLAVLEQFMVTAPEILIEPICYSILKIGQKQRLDVIREPGSPLFQSVLASLNKTNDHLADLIADQLAFTHDPEIRHQLFQRHDDLPSNLLVTLLKSVRNETQLQVDVCSLVLHEDDWVAYTAIEVLTHFSPHTIASAILPVFDSERELPVIAAMKLAVNMRLIEAIPAIQRLAASDNEDIAASAQQALEELQNT